MGYHNCTSLDNARGRAVRAWGTVPDIGLGTVLEDSEVGEQLRVFILKAGLDRGCRGCWTGKAPPEFTE
jgi:hypothetical protein